MAPECYTSGQCHQTSGVLLSKVLVSDSPCQSKPLSTCLHHCAHEHRLSAEKQVRDAAKRGDIRSAKMLAKEIVHTRKACSTCPQ